MHVIIYNTLMGVCAGTGMLLAASALSRLQTLGDGDHAHVLRGYGAAFLVLGAPLTFLAAAMTVTWPLDVNPPVNVAFGEPCLLLGVLMVVAGVRAFTGAGRTTNVDVDVNVNLTPVSYVVAVAGLVLASTASAILSYDLVGDAPPLEPITGQVRGWENTTWGLAYAVAALGCLLTPLVFTRRWASRVVVASWALSGAFFLLFAVLNYRTHIGLLINLQRGTHHRW